MQFKKDIKKDTLEKSEIDSGAIEAVTDDFINQDEDIPRIANRKKQREMVLSSMKEFIEKGNEEFVMSLEKYLQERRLGLVDEKLKILKTLMFVIFTINTASDNKDL